MGYHGSGAGIELATSATTPTLSAGVNVAASSDISGHFVRVGSIVMFSITATITPTAAVATSFELSIVFASNFVDVSNAKGTVTGANVSLGGCEGSVANDTLVVTYTATDTNATPVKITGSYRIL